MHDVFPVFGPSAQVGAKTASLRITFDNRMGHTYNIEKNVKMQELYLHMMIFNTL